MKTALLSSRVSGWERTSDISGDQVKKRVVIEEKAVSVRMLPFLIAWKCGLANLSATTAEF